MGVEFVQQRLARAVKVVRHVQRAGRQRAKYLKSISELVEKKNYFKNTVSLTLWSVSSMTIRMGLSSLCIFRYSEFSEKPCRDVLKTSDHE